MKILMLTDHTSHTAYDSVYALPKAMAEYSDNIEVYAASRAISSTHFLCQTPMVDCCIVDHDFSFDKRDEYFKKDKMSAIHLSEFKVIFFRIDRPITDEYFNFCREIAPKSKYINSPEGLINTSSKEFLTNFRNICPEFIIANSLNEIEEFSSKFPIVLKPLGGYGGDGLIKITSVDEILVGVDAKRGLEAREFLNSMPNESYPIMAMKYLNRVNEGDKRILVVSGECLGAVLRVPKQGSWLCNLAQGATSETAELTEEECKIVNTVDLILSKEGINVYGIDTLVDDNGKRVLSEINSTNVGGFVQLQKTSEIDIMHKTVNLIFERLKVG